MLVGGLEALLEELQRPAVCGCDPGSEPDPTRHPCFADICCLHVNLVDLYRLFIDIRLLQSFALCAPWKVAKSSYQPDPAIRAQQCTQLPLPMYISMSAVASFASSDGEHHNCNFAAVDAV